MADELFLQTILNEQRATRDDILELSKSMVHKTEFADLKDEISRHFESINQFRTEQLRTTLTLQQSENDNTNFRKGFLNSLKYIGGAVFVSLLGIASAVVPSYFPHPVSAGITQSTSSTITSPAPTLIKPLKIKIALPGQ